MREKSCSQGFQDLCIHSSPFLEKGLGDVEIALPEGWANLQNWDAFLCLPYGHLRQPINSSPELLGSKALFYKGYGSLGIKFA